MLLMIALFGNGALAENDSILSEGAVSPSITGVPSCQCRRVVLIYDILYIYGNTHQAHDLQNFI